MAKFQILSNDDLRFLTAAQLKEYLRLGVAVANKRIKRLRDLMIPSPAVSAMRTATGRDKFTSAPGNRKQMQREAAILNNFLQSETSTIKGARRVVEYVNTKIQNAAESLGQETGQEFLGYVPTSSSSHFGNREFWRGYNKWIEGRGSEFVGVLSSDRLVAIYSEVVRQGESRLGSVSKYQVGSNGEVDWDSYFGQAVWDKIFGRASTDALRVYQNLQRDYDTEFGF